MSHIQKILLIINAGEGSKALQIAKENGALGGTILPGRGTSNNIWLKLLKIDDIKKEVLIFIAPKDVSQAIAKELLHKLQLHKPNKGILALQDVSACFASRRLDTTELAEGDNVNHEYVLITVIVERGRSHDVMQTATSAGARGGTIIPGRGSGTLDTTSVFNIPVMPEKDIVLLLIHADGAKPIIEAIQKELSINKPGQGIIFTQPVDEVFGMSSLQPNQSPQNNQS